MPGKDPSTQPAAERRTAEAEVKRLVAKFAPAHKTLAATARRWLRKRLPTAYEIVYEYRDCYVISFSPSDRGYEGVFAVRGDPDGIRLYFTAGKLLKDPEKVLKGSAGARYVELEGASTLRRTAVTALFDQAMARNKAPFPRTGKGPVVLSPTLSKQKTKARK